MTIAASVSSASSVVSKFFKGIVSKVANAAKTLKNKTIGGVRKNKRTKTLKQRGG